MRKAILGFVPILLILVQLACNFPQAVGPAPQASEAPAIPIVVEVASATATQTATSTPIPTPQDPLVLRATLCWRGPGSLYVVVSGLKLNERVKLLGVGSIPGWFIVDNPTYHEPCWVQATDLQVDAGIDLTALKIYSPPPLKPTKTPKPTATPV
jgi:hypothetical protein